MAIKVSASAFIDWLAPHAGSNAPGGQWGYIMGAHGQPPKELSSWYFNQYKDRSDYTASQEKKALYWRDNAERVMDCNGCAEGYYRLTTGININTRARYNYSSWCAGSNGTNMKEMPRVKGCAVFHYPTHVGFLEKPVVADKPEGDWYVLEARGVSYGVVRTKFSERGWDRWGLMNLYFDYSDSAYEVPVYNLGDRVLKRGMTGEDVRDLQSTLISFKYNCGEDGADGEFGENTESALKSFQLDAGREVTGVYELLTHASLIAKVVDLEKEDTVVQLPIPAQPDPKNLITVTGGSVNLRTGPGSVYSRAGVVHAGDKLEKIDCEGWCPVLVNGELRWISEKYVK